MIAQIYETRLQIKRPIADQGPLCLSLSLAPDAFSYALSLNRFQEPVEFLAVSAGPDRGQIAPAAAFEFFVANNRLSSQHFDKIVVSILSSDFTLFPAAFSTDENTKVLDFVNGNNNKKHLLHQFQGIHLTAGVDRDLLTVLERFFPGASIRHAGAVSLNLFFLQHSLSGADIFLNCVGHHMELMARKDGQLLFYNIFNHQSDEDILYYLLFAMEQFDLDPARVRLTVAGDRLATDPLFTSLGRYVRHLSFCAHDASLSLKGDFAKLPSHAYFHLLNQHLCE